MGSFQGRCVIDAVTRHGNDLAIPFQGIHDNQLLFGDDSGKDIYILYSRTKFRFGHHFQLRSTYACPVIPETNLTGDIHGCNRVVARDHDNPDPRPVTFSNGIPYFGTDGVGKADQSEEFEVEIMLIFRKCLRTDLCHGNSQNAEAVPGHLFNSASIFLPNTGRQVTKVANHFRGSFSSNNPLTRCMFREHPRH